MVSSNTHETLSVSSNSTHSFSLSFSRVSMTDYYEMLRLEINFSYLKKQQSCVCILRDIISINIYDRVMLQLYKKNDSY